MNNILIVDYQLSNIKILKYILEPLQGNVLVADNFEEALNISQEHNLIAIIVNEFMPGISGFQMAQMFKINFPDTVVYISTKSNMFTAMPQNIDGVLKLPYDQKEIVKSLSTNVRIKAILLKDKLEETLPHKPSEKKFHKI